MTTTGNHCPYLISYSLRFVKLITGDYQLNRLSASIIRPQFFIATFSILANHPVRHLEDLFGRTIVLLQLDLSRSRKISLKVKNISIVRPPPTID